SRGDGMGRTRLSHEYSMASVRPIRSTSAIGGSTMRRTANGFHENTFQPTYAPENNLAGHLEFMLRHERIHLEFLSRLFEKVNSEEIRQWVLRQPNGQFARRVGWLHEWMTGKELDVPIVR